MRARVLRGGARLALAAVVAIGLGACSSGDDGSATTATTGVVADEGRLVACLEPSHQPFTTPDDAAPGGVAGLDVAVLDEVATLLELELVLRPEADVRLLAELAAGSCDLAAGGLVQPGATGDVTTRAYAEGALVLVVREASARRLASLDDLTGAGVAVVAGSPGHRWALGEAAGAQLALQLADSTGAALDAVEDRSAAAAVVDRFDAAAALPARPGLTAVTQLVGQPGPVFVTRVPGLRSDVDGALDRLDGDGRLDALIDQLVGPLPAGPG